MLRRLGIVLYLGGWTLTSFGSVSIVLCLEEWTVGNVLCSGGWALPCIWEG